MCKNFIKELKFFTVESKSYMGYGTDISKRKFWLRYPKVFIGYMKLQYSRQPEQLKRVIKLTKKRAYIFTCSYKTAWDNWMLEEEKEWYLYEEIEPHLNK